MLSRSRSSERVGMVKATLGHVGLNLSDSEKSFRFWKDLVQYFGFKITADDNGHVHASDGHVYLCLSQTQSAHNLHGFHRKRTGLNHVAFRVESPELVDRFVKEFLEPRQIKALYEGAKAYP